MKYIKLFLLVSFLLAICTACSTDREPEYGFVIASGDGYNLVASLRAGADGSDMVGVRDDRGRWIHPLSEGHPLIDEDGRIKRTRNTQANTTVIVPGNMSGFERDRTQQSAGESFRRTDISSSFKHYDGAIFSLIRTGQSQVVAGHRFTPEHVIVYRYYDARNNILMDADK